MTERRERFGSGALVGAVGVLVLLAAIGLGVVFTGAYNVAATEPHSAPARWVLSTTMDNSVHQRAAEVPQAPDFTAALVAAGAGEYKEMCQHCHGAPGADREKWAHDMLPEPPDLKEAAGEWQAREIFWIVKHGIRMSGMPAFGPTHDDKELWSIAAFVKQLPSMTPERYAAFERESDADHGAGPEGSGHRSRSSSNK